MIGCAENYPQHIALPRGCLDAVQDLLAACGIQAEIEDRRQPGTALPAVFCGELRAEQQQAVTAVTSHECGILCAPTAFGKTVTAAAVIARRQANTLILVHRAELLRQWQQRLQDFLVLPNDRRGSLGAGKNRLSGGLDIALMQTLSRRDDLAGILAPYGQVIVDECHHVSAFSFEQILKNTPAKYILGLTATPIRRDGHQPIVLMQCGKIRHHARHHETLPQQRSVCVCPSHSYCDADSIQTVSGTLPMTKSVTTGLWTMRWRHSGKGGKSCS